MRRYASVTYLPGSWRKAPPKRPWFLPECTVSHSRRQLSLFCPSEYLEYYPKMYRLLQLSGRSLVAGLQSMKQCWELVLRSWLKYSYFGHDPLRSYLNTFDTFIMIVPKYLGHVHYDHAQLSWTCSLWSSLTALIRSLWSSLTVFNTFIMFIPNYLGHVLATLNVIVPKYVGTLQLRSYLYMLHTLWSFLYMLHTLSSYLHILDTIIAIVPKCVRYVHQNPT
jgi:hypothetical protein